MSLNPKSLQTEKFLGQNEIHAQWQSDYLNSDLDRFYDLAFADILKVINPLPTEKILDAGCGYCYHTVRLARSGALITAVDFSEVALEAGRRVIAQAGIADRVETRQADLTALPFADNSFDSVVSWGVIMHVPEMEKALAELARVLKPGGVLVLCENNLHSPDVAIRERLVRTTKKLIGRSVPELQKSRRGTETWTSSSSGGLMVRKTDMRFLTEFLRDTCQVQQFARSAGQFTELYTNLPWRNLKRLVYSLNMFYYKYIRSPRFAMGNIIYFRKIGTPDNVSVRSSTA
jgi:ubiquinone/menaquinone biosynthesis C-methylase UbiE